MLDAVKLLDIGRNVSLVLYLHELLRAVVDDGQIAVSAVGDFGSELDLELLTLFFFVCHERVVCYVDE